MPVGHVLVLVSVDPETSHRANEAIRIALGLIAGENAVTIMLLGPAVKILAPGVEEYVDGEDIAKHLATLAQLGQAFHVEREAIQTEPSPTPVSTIPVVAEEVSRLVATADRVLVF